MEGNVTELTHLVLANFHRAQKGGPGISSSYHGLNLVLANLGDQLKLGFTILKANTKKRTDHGGLTFQAA